MYGRDGLFQIEEYLGPPPSQTPTTDSETVVMKTRAGTMIMEPKGGRARQSVMMRRMDLQTSLSQLQTEKLPPASSDELMRRFTHVQAPSSELSIPWNTTELPLARRSDRDRERDTNKTRKTDKVNLQKFLRLSGLFISNIVNFFFVFSNFNILVNDLDNPDMSGFLVKQGAIRMNWKRRWFVLKAHHLFYYRSRQVSLLLIKFNYIE
jgi:hypothetical protein